MKEIFKQLAVNIKNIKPTHCITLMTVFGCLLVAQSEKTTPTSNEAITEKIYDYEEDTLS